MAYNALARASVVIELFEGDEKYEANVVSTNGVILQPYDTSTTLIGTVTKNGVDITADIKNIRWTKWNPTEDNLVECPEWNEKRVGYSTIQITKEDIDSKSIFVFEAYNDIGNLLCSASISLVDINDLLVSTKEPQNPYVGQLWVDDSTSPASLFVWNGYKWVLAGAVGTLIKNLLQNTGFALNFEKWEIVGETKLSFTPYPYDYLGHTFLKLQSETNVDVSRGLAQTAREDVLPNSEYSYQMLYYTLEDSNAYSNRIQLRIYSLDKYDQRTLLYEKSLKAENNLKKVYARFNSLYDTVAIRVEICGENGFRYHFNIAEAALYNTHNEYPWTIHPSDLKIFGSQLTQEDVWNILSCNGTVQGIFSRVNPDTGQLEYYINASMIQAGKMKAQYMEMYGLKVLRKEEGEETDKVTLEVTEDGEIILDVKRLSLVAKDGTKIDDVGDSVNNLEFEMSPEQFKVKVDKIATDENGEITQHITSIATQTADGFSTTVKNELSGQISEVKQTADKIYWIVDSGDSMSSMTLTDKAYELISKNVTIKAEVIRLEGYTTINGGFAIDLEGNMYAKNGTFEGDISASKIFGSEIEGTNLKSSHLESSTITSTHLESSTIASTKMTTSTVIAPNIYSDETDNPVFSLTSDGTLKAYNAVMSGYIQGAVIDAGVLKNQVGTFSVEADGILHAEGAEIKGSITAGSTIKGSTIIGSSIKNREKDPTFTVTSDGVVTGAQLRGGSIGIGGIEYDSFTVDNNGNCHIKKGTISIGNNFSVNSIGELTAKSASFTGNIESGSTIKGSTIIGTTIQNKAANPTFQVDKDGNVKGATISGGSINIGNGNFKVDEKGNLTAKTGSFTGTINSGTKIIGATIQNAEKDPTFKVDANGNISGGSININNAFTVDKDGKLSATDAVISGEIKATSGTIGGNTSIDGDCIVTGSISSGKLAIGDFTNYCEANEQNCKDYGMYTEYEVSPDGANLNGLPWMVLKTVKRSTPLVESRDGSPYKRYTGSLKGTYRVQFECSSSARGLKDDSATAVTYLDVRIGFYCKDRTGANKYYYCKDVVASSKTAETVEIDSSITIPNTVQSFGVYLQVVGVDKFTGTVKIRNVRVTRMIDNALIVNGSITADHISGKTLTGITLQNKSQTFKVDANGNITGGSINIGDGTFKVTNKGKVTASDIKITGGELNINDVFKVDTGGALTSTSGAIGGFTIGKTTLKGYRVGLGASTATRAFWAGSNIASEAPFNVTHQGVLTATDANIQGKIQGSEIIGSKIRNENNTFYIDAAGNIKGASLTSSVGGNFYIDSQGNMAAQNLAVEDEISTSVLICDKILNKDYPPTLSSGATLYVNANGNDANKCINGNSFASIQGAINSIPKYMNGKTVHIHLQRDTWENVSISYFSSGRILIYLNGKTLNGHVHVYCSSASVQLYGGDSTSSTTYGAIKPSTGCSVGSRTVSAGCDRSSFFGLYYINLHRSSNQASGCSGDIIGAATTGNGYLYCGNVRVTSMDVGFRASNGGHLHATTTYGLCNKYGWEATTGGIISLNSSSHAGGNTASTNRGNAGQIWKDSPTFEQGTPPPAPTPPPPTAVARTYTVTSSGANAIQSGKWRTDKKPKAGNYGYGDHTAWWFFDDGFDSMANKEVNKIEITFTRQQGGAYEARPIQFYAHYHGTQPSGTSMNNNGTKVASTSTAINTTPTISITSSSAIDIIKKAKGICSIPTEQNAYNYIVFSGSMTVKFHYTDYV